jgi:DNA polymerase iota
VEAARNPALRGRPMGVRQKNLVVTTNYEARTLGVPKMARVSDVARDFPSVVIVDGECLDPYREVRRGDSSVANHEAKSRRTG